jgi:pimeloyl-ACP methyl ester carboxylesterase
MQGKGLRGGAGMSNASQFRSIWTDLDGLRMHAMAADGPGDPVVLVHGLGLSHRYMMPTAERLAGDFRVLVPDLPGFGESGHPQKILDVPGLADGLAAWIAAAGLGRAALLGNSHACQIIIDLAARHPDRVSMGVLQGPTTPPSERTWLRQFVRWRQNAPFNPPELGPLTWGEYGKSGYLRVLGTFRHTLRDRPEDKCPEVVAPMLVVRGQLDPICHEDWAEKLADLLPNGRIALIPGVAHTLVFTAPEQLATVTRQFLCEPR